MSIPATVATLGRDGSIAVLVIDYPPVNALGQLVRDAIADALNGVAGDDAIAALVIRCDGRTYFAGADIREFGKPRTPPYLPDLFAQIENCPKPVITAIHGNALGGGLELAMACHFRLATRSSKLGLPEVTLGILPGAGGTQRLPRLIGTAKALDMLTSGRPIEAAEALERGLIDGIIDGDIAQDALAFARAVVNEGRAICRTRDRDEKILDVRDDPQIIDRFEVDNAEKFRNLDAPPAIFTSVRGLLCTDFADGIAIERAQFLALREGPQAAALRYTFLAEREAAKVPGVPASVRAQPVDSIGIVGSSTAATNIAVDFLRAGCSILMVDETGDALSRCVSSIRERINDQLMKGRMSQAAAAEANARLRAGSSFEALSAVDVVIEAAEASVAMKRDMLSNVERVAQPSAPLGTIVSRPDVDEIAASLGRPDRIFGLKCLFPDDPTKLIEVIRGQKTSGSTLASAMSFVKRITKTAVVAGDSPGFIGQRMLAVQLREAEAMIAQGIDPVDIDRVAHTFGMVTGLFRLGDMTGTPWRATGVSGTSQIGDSDILKRLHYPLINEGALLLDEGGALRASDIDILWLKGFGWPAWTGGPMFLGDRIGLPALVSGLERLGIKPGSLLVRLANEQKGFADFDAISK